MEIKLNKLFLIFCIFSIHLIPFARSVSFETFPALLLLVILYIFLFEDFSFKSFVERNKIIILLITYLLFFHISYLEHNYIELIKYLIGPIIFLFYFNIKKYIGFNEILLFGIGIIILYLIFLLQIPILFSVTCNSLEFFISRLQCINTDNLTRPFLITPEPSYLALMLSFYLIILNHFKQNLENKYQKILLIFVELSVCYIIYTTHSRIGLFFTIFYLVYFIYNYKLYFKTLFLFSISVISIYIIFFLNLSLTDIKTSKYYDKKIMSSRNILNIDFIVSRYQDNLSPVYKIQCRRIENKILTDDNYNDRCKIENNLLTIINVSEPTGFIRIFHNYLSFKAAFENNFLGYGLGSYSILWYQHALKFKVDHLVKINEVMSTWMPYIERKKQYVQNYFFSILHDGGFVPATLLIIIIIKSFINVFKNRYTFGYIIFFYVIITFFFQSTISSPYPWLALAIILFDRKKYA